MRLDIVLSVAVLLVITFTDATPTKNTPTAAKPDEGSSSGSESNNEGNEASVDNTACDHSSSLGVFRLEQNVDTKTAKKVLNLLRKGNGKGTCGEEGMTVIFDAKLTEDNRNDMISIVLGEDSSNESNSADDSDSSSSSDSSSERQEDQSDSNSKETKEEEEGDKNEDGNNK